MKIYWAELFDSEAPLALRRCGLVQLSALALLLQVFHLALAWVAVPDLSGLPQWAAWALSVFFVLVLWLIAVWQPRMAQRPHLVAVQQVFLSALWLGAACLAAIFCARLGFHLGVALFLLLGCLGYGIALGRLWFGLRKA